MNGGDANQQQQQHQQQLLQHQNWMAMQYQQHQWMMMQQNPAAAMHQQMMYNQHYAPYYQAQHHPQQQFHHQQPLQQQPLKQNNQIQNSGEDNKTIWIGDLLPWMDEGYLISCFSQSGEEVLSAKVIRNKNTGQSDKYGFVEFSSHAAAEKALSSYNGTTMPNAEQPFRLNWAGFNSGDRRTDAGADMSIFVGDLAPEVTDAQLHETFASRYPSVKGAKVVVDPNSGRAKGYGFVRFGDESEKSRALTEMNGEYCLSRAMRVGVATPKKPLTQQPQQYSSQAVVLSGGYPANGAVSQAQLASDTSNTTIFVGGLDADVTDEELKQYFVPFGEVVSTKIPAGKGCGFVQFGTRSSAEEAIQRLHGTVIGKQTVRLSWGRNLGNKERGESNGQWNGNGSQYGRQGYNNGYAGGYGPTSNGNGNHQQQMS